VFVSPDCDRWLGRTRCVVIETHGAECAAVVRRAVSRHPFVPILIESSTTIAVANPEAAGYHGAFGLFVNPGSDQMEGCPLRK